VANLSLTLRCQRRCGFCFAGEQASGEPSGDMPPTIFRAALSRLQDAGIDQVRLLGGEPTLHGRFVEYVEEALGAGMRVLVFSNGLMPEPTARFLAAHERVAVLVNAGAQRGAPPEELEWQGRTLGILGRRAYLSCTVSGPGTVLEDLLDVVDRHGLQRTIRLGLAQPHPDGTNAWVAPRQYTAVGLRIAELAEAAAGRGMRVEFDCGLVPCMFPAEFVDSGLCDTQRLGTTCGPVPDILPDGTAIACYPLARLARVKLLRYRDLGAVRRVLSEAARPFRHVGILPECAGCRFKQEGRCLGGCLALSQRRVRRAAPRQPRARPSALAAVPPAVRIEPSDRSADKTHAQEPPAPRFVVPYIDQPIEFWDRLATDFGGAISEVYFPLAEGGIGSGRPAQPTAHLASFLRRSPLPLAVVLNPVVLPRPLGAVGDQIIEALRRLDGEHGIKGVTVSNLQLASRIRRELPHFQVVGSILMDVERPNQALMLSGVCHVLVPSGRVLRDRAALRELRRAFAGRLRLIVNEGCLPGCPLRIQHFFEMGTEQAHPQSLCVQQLTEQPWMRLTGAWILPQHLGHYEGLFDELKLSGRVTLRDPERYRRVLAAYVSHTPLPPHEIGAGPAAPIDPIEIDEEFVERTLGCGLRCHVCTFCQSYYMRHTQLGAAEAATPPEPAGPSTSPRSDGTRD
jgi:hypothetical protein